MIQLWSKSGIMLTAMLTKEEAKKLINEGKAKRINDQAIIYVKWNKNENNKIW